MLSKDKATLVVTVDDTKDENSNTVLSSGFEKVVFRLVSAEDNIKEEKIEAVVVNNTAECIIPKGFKCQIYAQTFDMVGNFLYEKTSKAFVVDGDEPVVTIEPLPDNKSKTDDKGNRLYTDTVKLKVTITDTKSRLKSVSYTKSSDMDSYDDVVTKIGYATKRKLNEDIGNGWKITRTDNNLVTEVSQTFVFDKDDKNICMIFNANDNSTNDAVETKSKRFTIDTVSPTVEKFSFEPVTEDNISEIEKFIEELEYGFYFKKEFNAVVSVDDTVPSSGLNKVSFRLVSYDNGEIVSEEVQEISVENKEAVCRIPAGFKGQIYTEVYDKASNKSGEKTPQGFVVDEVPPTTTIEPLPDNASKVDMAGNKLYIGTVQFKVTISDEKAGLRELVYSKSSEKDSFEDFGEIDDKQIYFNTAQTAVIEVVEHNFYGSDMNIVVKSKASGTAHTADDEGWYYIGYASNWKHNGDKHTLQIKFEQDGIYTISLSPIDRAKNTAPGISSAIYEIDTTNPQLYKRNDQYATDKDFVTTPYREVYDEEKKESPAPSVEFEDLNFDRIEIEAVIYRPEYKNGKEFGEVKVDSLSEELSGSIKNKKFTLSDFKKDGVYSLTYVAVDKAGNKSEPINDTYFRMIETDVLAYINNSSVKEKTGYYFLMDEDGNPISKKASDFKDLSISVIKLKGDKESGVLTLRDDEQKYSPEDYTAVEDTKISETAIITEAQLPASYFTEIFRDDSLDTRMHLSVSIDKNAYLDLASIHIDNEPPTAIKPDDFVNWQNYFFTKEVTISLTNISETLNANACKVYECPRDGERAEIPFEYDKEKKTLTFTLSEGLHNIDITLVDEAGNESNLDRVKNLRVGNFRLYLCVGIGVMFIGVIIGIVLWRKKKQN